MSTVPSWLRSPRTLLVVLVLGLVLGVAFAASTSTAAFGVYNPAWDGASQLQEQATAVDTDSRIALNTSVYRGVDPNETVALVLTPDRAYEPRDAARLRRFVERGGTLVVAEDFGPHSNQLLEDVGATTRVDGRLLRDERYYHRSPNITVATGVQRSQFTTGVDQLTLNHGTALVANTSPASESDVLVNSSSFAYLDGNRNAAFDDRESLERRPVATVEPVGQGLVVVVADPSMMINAMLDRPGNQQFVRNVFAAHEQVILDYSHAERLPPLSYALVVVRDSGPLQTALGLLGVGAVALASRRWNPLRRESSSSPDPVETDVLVAQLRTEHPNWDEERLERVARSRRRTGGRTE